MISLQNWLNCSGSSYQPVFAAKNWSVRLRSWWASIAFQPPGVVPVIVIVITINILIDVILITISRNTSWRRRSYCARHQWRRYHQTGRGRDHTSTFLRRPFIWTGCLKTITTGSRNWWASKWVQGCRQGQLFYKWRSKPYWKLHGNRHASLQVNGWRATRILPGRPPPIPAALDLSPLIAPVLAEASLWSNSRVCCQMFLKSGKKPGGLSLTC